MSLINTLILPGELNQLRIAASHSNQICPTAKSTNYTLNQSKQLSNIRDAASRTDSTFIEKNKGSSLLISLNAALYQTTIRPMLTN